MESLILLLNVIASMQSRRLDEGTAEKLKLLADLIKAGKQGSEEVRALTAEIQAMVDAGREPTAEEFEAVRARRAALSAELRGLETGPGAPQP